MGFRLTIFLASIGFSAILFFACKKPKAATPETPAPVNSAMVSGLPAKPSSINGYLFYSLKNTPFSGLNITCFATFKDPGGSLMEAYNHVTEFAIFNNPNTGNVAVGDVSANDIMLTKSSFSPSLIYSTSFNVPQFTTTVHWSTDGNGSFRPLDINLPRACPVLTNAAFPSVSKANGYLIDLTGYSNYDSAYVAINAAGSQLSKRVAVVNSVTFSSAELSNLVAGSTCTIKVYLFNYSHQIINDKTYVFEMSNKYETNVTLNP